MIDSSKIITGEKIQQKCDLYLGYDEDFQFNPIISVQKEKHCYFDSINSAFANPFLIFCHSHHVSILSEKILFFENPFVLVTHNSDGCISESKEVFTILKYEKLEKWYAQNLCFEDPKLFFLPIGLANSMWTHGNVSIFDNVNIINHLQIKTKKIYFQFNIYTNISKRHFCYDELKNKLEWLPIIEPDENLKRLKEYEFCVCPEGNGFDTHRLWEALYLKVVPIVIQSNFTKILQKQNLPLVVLESWDQLNIDELNYQDYSFDCITEKFTMDFFP